MFKLERSVKNPILSPNKENFWESKAVFNGCPARKNSTIHLVYRALSGQQEVQGINMPLSTIGHAVSKDGISFEHREQLIKPAYNWEAFGCEDPRITKFEDEYFIFYTALSGYPFSSENIKIGLAITKDFKTIEKYPVTTFNAKAMALFPDRINEKIAAVLTVNTDKPPAKIAIAYFDNKEQIYSAKYWKEWYDSLDEHVVPLLRSPNDHLEVGAQPIKTSKGWLLFYSYIQNYFSGPRVFGIETLLLDLHDAQKVISRICEPVLIPEEKYELDGMVPNIVFPSGAIINKDKFYLYYGAADTYCCLATIDKKEFLSEFKTKTKIELMDTCPVVKLQRFVGNPIIKPRPEFAWETRATFNAAAIYLDKKVHLLYRALSNDETSTLGYASSKNGFIIDERLHHPVYVPREEFELKNKPGLSGCEDPRITQIDDKLYMCYTAYDGVNPPRVALTSILTKDFLNKKWNWEKPKLISPPGISNKNTCILPEKVNGKYMFFHRVGVSICIDFVQDLSFKNNTYLKHDKILFGPRRDLWDNKKVGITGLPIKTKKGWLLIYHGVCNPGSIYKFGAALLDLKDPSIVLARTDCPIFEPEMLYEKEGTVPNVVFSCGTITIKDNVFVYYGGADKVIGVAVAKLSALLKNLKK
ncbi:hypothetical protein K9L05_04415 [Candidatus Babeliales bacterium]|nr:hypothetical protein [Candidatus Babeliales bacterium]MCF7899855.1 hypothetical protein [Candidatus Babeliales bacterium]